MVKKIASQLPRHRRVNQNEKRYVSFLPIRGDSWLRRRLSTGASDLLTAFSALSSQKRASTERKCWKTSANKPKRHARLVSAAEIFFFKNFDRFSPKRARLASKNGCSVWRLGQSHKNTTGVKFMLFPTCGWKIFFQPISLCWKVCVYVCFVASSPPRFGIGLRSFLNDSWPFVVLVFRKKTHRRAFS